VRGDRKEIERHLEWRNEEFWEGFEEELAQEIETF
jgi:hypothetical protein